LADVARYVHEKQKKKATEKIKSKSKG